MSMTTVVRASRPTHVHEATHEKMDSASAMPRRRWLAVGYASRSSHPEHHVFPLSCPLRTLLQGWDCFGVVVHICRRRLAEIEELLGSNRLTPTQVQSNVVSLTEICNAVELLERSLDASLRLVERVPALRGEPAAELVGHVVVLR